MVITSYVYTVLTLVNPLRPIYACLTLGCQTSWRSPCPGQIWLNFGVWSNRCIRLYITFNLKEINKYAFIIRYLHDFEFSNCVANTRSNKGRGRGVIDNKWKRTSPIYLTKNASIEERGRTLFLGVITLYCTGTTNREPYKIENEKEHVKSI